MFEQLADGRRTAIMQPYLFPYIGYMNLVAAADVFVFYDDVNFIKGGWINRNRILLNARPFMCTLPLVNLSPNALIKDTKIFAKEEFARKFEAQLVHAYKKAPYFEQGLSYVANVLGLATHGIGDLAAHSVMEFFRALNIEKDFRTSSKIAPQTRELAMADRLIEITQLTGSTHFINPIGGTSLYDKCYFAERGVNLSFVRPMLQPYRQHGSREFEPGLSVIDLMMSLSVDELRQHVTSFELV